MARPVKITPDEIERAALDMVRAHGLDAVTARALADALGISTQPIYSGFGSMDTLKSRVAGAAQQQVTDFLAQPEPGVPPMLTVAIRTVRLASEAPHLFALMDDWMRSRLGASVPPETIGAYRRDPRLAEVPREDLERLDVQLWVVTRGLAGLVGPDDQGALTLADARRLLTEIGEALIAALDRGRTTT